MDDSDDDQQPMLANIIAELELQHSDAWSDDDSDQADEHQDAAAAVDDQDASVEFTVMKLAEFMTKNLVSDKQMARFLEANADPRFDLKLVPHTVPALKAAVNKFAGKTASGRSTLEGRELMGDYLVDAERPHLADFDLEGPVVFHMRDPVEAVKEVLRTCVSEDIAGGFEERLDADGNR
jgi:hypothetical protein